MFLAHFSHTGLEVLMEMEAADLKWWYFEAVKLHNKLNPSE